MAIDPIILLLEEIRLNQDALDKATLAYRNDDRREHGDLVNILLTRLSRQWGKLLKTAPTSAIGAAELARIAAQRLPISYSRYTARINKIADSLSRGQRLQSDLIWMRAVQGALSEGLYGADSTKVAPLLLLAIAGAARPVIIYRTDRSTSGAANWQRVLAIQPVA
jgi:hypothetical protein